MEKNFTLTDLYRYAEEINQRLVENKIEEERSEGPSKLAIKNILGYSAALRVMKTASIGKMKLLLN